MPTPGWHIHSSAKMESPTSKPFRVKTWPVIILSGAAGAATFLIIQVRKNGRLVWADFVGVGFVVFIFAITGMIRARRHAGKRMPPP
jgi:hypothetical protein